MRQEWEGGTPQTNRPRPERSDVYICVYMCTERWGLTGDREYNLLRGVTPGLLTSGLKIPPIRIGFTLIPEKTGELQLGCSEPFY